MYHVRVRVVCGLMSLANTVYEVLKIGEKMCKSIEINTEMTIFDIPPYFFFYVIGIAFASSLFMILLLKNNYDVSRYTKIFLLSGIGLLAGARIFGILSGLFSALSAQDTLSFDALMNTGIVFYGGLIGFILAFISICKIWNKRVDFGVIDIVAVCIPLFHFWGRLGCFFSGCCYGIESTSILSINYTNRVEGMVITVSRIPVQLIEAVFNIAIFAVLMILLFMRRCKECLLLVYLSIYAILRFVLEFFRGDLIRGVWNGISFSQFISVVILIIYTVAFIFINRKGREHEDN